MNSTLYTKLSIGFLCLIVSYFLLNSCKNDKRIPRDTDDKKITYDEKHIVSNSENINDVVLETKELKSVNVFFENSLSINGYLEGDSFIKNMYRLDEFSKEYKNYNNYFVNTKEYKISNFFESIKNKNIRKGNVTQSDHQFIFSNAIIKAKDNGLSIVVTDGIYSVNNRNLTIVPLEIESAFKQAIKSHDIATYIIKLSSNYDGTYYFENCKEKNSQKINQSRPYYIFLFGMPSHVNKFIDKVKNELEDIQNFTNYTIRDSYECDYTILTAGDEKTGVFKEKDRGSDKEVHDLIDAEKGSSNRGSNDKLIQFAVAVNLKDTSLSNNYLTDVNNYEVINNTSDYKISEILEIDKIDKSSKTIHELNKILKTKNKSYSHIIILNSESKIYGEVTVQLKKQLPKWIIDSGNDSDCNVKENTTKTIAFNKLVEGISEAYKKITKREDYVSINININH